MKIFLDQIKHQFLFICLTETWCKNESLDKNLNFTLPNYNIVHQKRSSKRKGGGVCIFIHDSINFKIRNDLSWNTNDLENLSVEIMQEKSKNFILSVMYRPPVGDMNQFLEHLKNVFDNCFNKPLYLLSDFNVNLLKYDKNKGAKSFVDLIFQYGSLPTI